VVTASFGKHFGLDVCLRPETRLRMILSAFLVFGLLYPSSSEAQSTEGIGVQADGPSSVHGRVLNRATHEPISRALVFSPDQRYATLTDHLGRFEFKFPPQVPEPKADAPSWIDADGLRNAYRARQLRMLQNARPETFLARKPGFLQGAGNPSSGRVAANQSEIVIYLDPEALVVGRVNLPGAEGDMRIRTDLYRREIREGQEHWELARTFTTWADESFVFAICHPGPTNWAPASNSIGIR
jgi:hypothetical protein